MPKAKTKKKVPKRAQERTSRDRLGILPAAIVAAMIEAEGNRSKAAELLGICRDTLHEKIDQYNLWPKIDRECKKRGLPVYPRKPAAKPVRGQ